MQVRSQSPLRQTDWVIFSFLFRSASLINFGFYIIWVIVVWLPHSLSQSNVKPQLLLLAWSSDYGNYDWETKTTSSVGNSIIILVLFYPTKRILTVKTPCTTCLLPILPSLTSDKKRWWWADNSYRGSSAQFKFRNWKKIWHFSIWEWGHIWLGRFLLCLHNGHQLKIISQLSRHPTGPRVRKVNQKTWDCHLPLQGWQGWGVIVMWDIGTITPSQQSAV